MAIRASFLTAVLGFSMVLVPGEPPPSAAESFAESPVPDDLSPPPFDAQIDLSLQRPAPDSGSSPEEPEWAAARPPEPDPWTEAFAESVKLRSVPAPTRATYPVVSNSQVQFFLDRFTRERRDVVGVWLSRAGRFMGMIRETLRRHGLPEDLAFTAMIESGFNPAAVSQAGAKGLWQFMAATARNYGLRVDQWVDERLDPEKSTAAAAAYLRDLHNTFGSWWLAQAAYNAGAGTVTRAVRATGSSDFWALAGTELLRRETKEFVPQILAATLIGREPGRYGFDLPPASPLPVDRVSVPGSTDLHGLSIIAGIPPDTLRSLNPVLVRGVTPPGSPYELKVPAGTGRGVLAALAAPKPPKVSVARVQGKRSVHVVRPRDTVSGIAQHYGVSVDDVMRWNRLSAPGRIRPGDRLRVADHPEASRDAAPTK